MKTKTSLESGRIPWIKIGDGGDPRIGDGGDPRFLFIPIRF
jgi:hypothetical protein